MKDTEIFISRIADKQLTKVPHFIREKPYLWIEKVELFGIEEVRKIPGFHDEPLKGERKWQRSIRLNHSYRAIYIEDEKGDLSLIEILEVTKHEY